MQVKTKETWVVGVCRITIRVINNGKKEDYIQNVGFYGVNYSQYKGLKKKKEYYETWKRLVNENSALRKKLGITKTSHVRIYVSFKKIFCDSVIKLKETQC